MKKCFTNYEENIIEFTWENRLSKTFNLTLNKHFVILDFDLYGGVNIYMNIYSHPNNYKYFKSKVQDAIVLNKEETNLLFKLEEMEDSKTKIALMKKKKKY